MSNKIQRFEDLEIWQRATEIAIEIYQISEEGKLSKDFGSKDQIRRSATSISNNIAEGFEYDNNKEFIKFLKYSKGSAGELRSQIYILFKAGYLEQKFYDEMYTKLLQISQ